MRLHRALALCLVLCWGTACVDSDRDESVRAKNPAPIAGSSYRIGPSQPSKEGEVSLRLLTTKMECARSPRETLEEIEACLPEVDRSTGQVKLSFEIRERSGAGDVLRFPLNEDAVEVYYEGRPQDPEDFELVPHDARRVNQLFILLIDGSGSMYEQNGGRIKAVRKALLNPDVVDSFFPGKGLQTGVILLRFTKTVRGLDGRAPTIIKSKKAYKAMVANHLISRDRGYTHLYDAVRYAVGDLLKAEAVDRFLQGKSASPTVIALTDGFNNERADDTCASNVPRLQKALRAIDASRSKVELVKRPTVYTVGFGTPIQRGFKVPTNQDPSNRTLCKGRAFKIINNGLERIGIDNPSLAWMAAMGGGVSFSKRSHRGLAKVFQEAAAERFGWYSVTYRLDPFYHRRSFTTKVLLKNFASGSSQVKIHPSAWIDAPTGRLGDDDVGFTSSPLSDMLAFIMPLLGLLVGLAFLGPAMFNARRAVFRRARPGQPAPVAPPAPESAPEAAVTGADGPT